MTEEELVTGSTATAVRDATRTRGAHDWLGRAARILEAVLASLLVLGLGEALIRGGVLSSPELPPPSVIAQALYRDVQHAEVWSALGATMTAWAVGLGAVIVAGVPVGMLLGLNRIAYAATQPTLEFIRTIPSIAGLPLLILFFGISMRLAVLMVFLGALWPVLIQTMYGVRDVDPVTKEVGRVYGLRRHQIFLRIVLPSSLPYVATGIRLASLIALLLAVSESLLAGGQGIGYSIVKAMLSANPPLMYARIVLLGFAGVAISLTVSVVEKRLLFWHASQRQAAA